MGRAEARTNSSQLSYHPPERGSFEKDWTQHRSSTTISPLLVLITVMRSCPSERSLHYVELCYKDIKTPICQPPNQWISTNQTSERVFNVDHQCSGRRYIDAAQGIPRTVYPPLEAMRHVNLGWALITQRLNTWLLGCLPHQQNPLKVPCAFDQWEQQASATFEVHKIHHPCRRSCVYRLGSRLASSLIQISFFRGHFRMMTWLKFTLKGKCKKIPLVILPFFLSHPEFSDWNPVKQLRRSGWGYKLPNSQRRKTQCRFLVLYSLRWASVTPSISKWRGWVLAVFWYPQGS